MTILTKRKMRGYSALAGLFHPPPFSLFFRQYTQSHVAKRYFYITLHLCLSENLEQKFGFFFDYDFPSLSALLQFFHNFFGKISNFFLLQNFVQQWGAFSRTASFFMRFCYMKILYFGVFDKSMSKTRFHLCNLPHVVYVDIMSITTRSFRHAIPEAGTLTIWEWKVVRQIWSYSRMDKPKF